MPDAPQNGVSSSEEASPLSSSRGAATETDDGESSIGMHVVSDPDETVLEQPEAAGAHERIQFPLRLVLASDLILQAEAGKKRKSG